MNWSQRRYGIDHVDEQSTYFLIMVYAFYSLKLYIFLSISTCYAFERDNFRPSSRWEKYHHILSFVILILQPWAFLTMKFQNGCLLFEVIMRLWLSFNLKWKGWYAIWRWTRVCVEADVVTYGSFAFINNFVSQCVYFIIWVDFGGSSFMEFESS